ncbi:MAG: divergent polysaccharide deacetylase family protein, partial [Alphaproteobacteria bacterium]|nr:divergent polysaccharide deacetylase family protein [Alphaproteobacteria bacterium]
IASYSDPIMAQTDSALEAIISESYGRGLGYMDLNPDTPDFFEQMALKNNAPYIKADMELLYPGGDKQSFDVLESIAKEKGYAVATVPPFPNIIKHLAIWIEKVGKIDYTILPVSAIYDVEFELGNLRNKHPQSSGTLKQSDMITPSHDAPHH